MRLPMMTRNIFVILFIFLGDFRIAVCMVEEVPVCSFKNDGNKCSKNKELDCKMKGKIDGKINITNVQFEEGKRQCEKQEQCDLCCTTLTVVHSEMLESVRDTCNNNTICDIPGVAGYNNTQKYSIHYHCVLPSKTTLTSNVTRTTSFTTLSTPNATPATSYTTTTTTPKSENPSTTTTIMLTSSTNINGQSSAQTGSNDFPTVSVAAPVAIVVILAIGILIVICIVRRRRQKNDGIYNSDDQNYSNIIEPVYNPAYTSDGLNQDSGYAECKEVDTVDNNNGEYNTINSQNIDSAYSHIPKQAQMVDNTYSHITSDKTNQSAASNYSHMDIKTRQPDIDVNHSTYNTLQTHAVNKPPQRLPVNGEESENEYNHANFSTVSSKQDDDDTEYSHLHSSNNGLTRALPSHANSSPNDVEYAEVAKNNNRHDLIADNDHAYFVLEKDDARGAAKEPCDSSDYNAHTYFVLEKDKANTMSNAESEIESTPHDYFVLTKQ